MASSVRIAPMQFVALLPAVILALPVPARAGSVPVQPLLDCIEGDRTLYQGHFGYRNGLWEAQTIPVSAENNLFIGGSISPSLGQPQFFLPGLHRGVFSAVFETAEAPAFFWALDGTLLRVSLDAPSCPYTGTPRLHAFAECASIDSATGQGQVRFGYFNAGGDAVGYASPHTYNRFGTEPITSASSARGQPSVFLPGFHSPAFTVQFDPRFEDGVAWQLEQNFVVAVPGLPGLPECDAGASMQIQGSGQQALPATDFNEPLRLRLRDAAGEPLAGQLIHWSGRAITTGPDALFIDAQTQTDADGWARAWVRANTTLGAYQVVAAALDARVSAAFHLENVTELALPPHIFSDSFE